MLGHRPGLRFMSKAALRGAENFRFFADRAPGARDGQSLPSPTLLNVTSRSRSARSA
jgi:5-carboxymethyl-2-hydroxymuconic-semialdehyde dehydrogenase